MMTAEQILNLKVGDQIRLNHDIHMVEGPNPKSWGDPMTVTEITYRGETDPRHPLGGGHPYVGVKARNDNWPKGSTWGFGIGIDDRGVEMAMEEAS